MRLVVLIPAHNEESSIAATLEAILAQRRPADLVVVAANGCTDRTAELARAYPVTVLELPRLEHRKSEALNIAWLRYAQDADLVACLDADTVLTPNSLGDWEREFVEDPALGGSSSKFTMLGDSVLTRLQKAEFARWTDVSLRRGWTSVLAGTGCCIRNTALRQVASSQGRPGPWHYGSQVEDFELSYRVRQLGYDCRVSTTVRAYTDSMRTLRSLWGQRMKWQVGTVEDLLTFGFNRLTRLDWFQQLAGLAAALVRLSWILVTALALSLGTYVFQPLWLLVPALFLANEVKQTMRVPHRDAKDILLAALLFPQELFAWLRAGWFLRAWWDVLWTKALRRSGRDRWAAQYAAENA
jgi:cellulose synthase/poly-beta-1,6-N-acetylglucosamine synthase-like glycosyltransferase